VIDATRIEAIFERFTTGYHFYLEDLRSGESVELGERGAWPIGSCFKLAVLIAYFEALADGILPSGSLDAETVIAPERFSMGAGVLNLLDTPIRLSDRQMLSLMITASDGTATDFLIEKLGLERVQETLRRAAPDSTLTCDLGELVRRFREVPGALDCKTRNWTSDEARTFRETTSRLGATHAIDLARLACAGFNLPRAADFDETMLRDYVRIIEVPRFPLRRSETFLEPPFRHVAKTVSIGRNYFTAEGGVIVNGDQPIANFGYCSEGWRLPAFVVETICGLIGLEMAAALGFPQNPNWDFTPEGAKLLLGDLWAV